jgi:parvulin-like peptidyl-prolyl isomerase
MTSVLQIGHSTLTAEEIIPLLVGYQMIPQLICENIIDRAIASIYCTPQEVAQAYQEFYQRWGLTSEDQRQAWRSHYGLTQEQLEQLATRKLRVEKFKQATWGHTLESYFLKRSKQLDQVIYSFIQNRDRGIANELYFRLREGEQSFAELASKYSQGPEAHTGGLVGPVELGTLVPNLAELLCTSQIGEVQPPVRFGESQVIVRLEKWIPARLDDKMRQRLLREKFETWFQEQLHQLSEQDQIWMGITRTRQPQAIGNLAIA